jgi:hypothetical protein
MIYTVDIAPSLRRLSGIDYPLFVGDTEVVVDFLNNGVVWPIPVIAGDWKLSIIGRESPASSLVDSSAWSLTDTNEITFTIDTTQAIAYLADRRQAEIILEVAIDDTTDKQTLARWIVTIFAQGS